VPGVPEVRYRVHQVHQVRRDHRDRRTGSARAAAEPAATGRRRRAHPGHRRDHPGPDRRARRSHPGRRGSQGRAGHRSHPDRRDRKDHPGPRGRRSHPDHRGHRGPKDRRDRKDRRTRPGHRGHQGHRDRKDHRDPKDHQDRKDRRTRPGHQDRRGRQDRKGHRARGHPGRPAPAGCRTAGPAGSARRAGSPARGASPGSRTRHRRRTTGPAAAGSGRPGWGRARAGAGRPGCTRSPCWSGSSTGTPRRTARRPHGACGTAGRALRRADRAAWPGAAGSRTPRPGAAAEGAGARNRPCGDRRPRTSRRNPTDVRSGRSACRRFPLSLSGRDDRVSPTPRGQARCFSVLQMIVLRHFFTRTVFVDRVSRVISSASSTFAFSRTVPVAASTTSTTFASSFAVSAFPESLAS